MPTPTHMNHIDKNAEMLLQLLAQYKNKPTPTASELAYDAETIGNGRKVFSILKQLEKANLVKSYRHTNMTCLGVTVTWSLS